MLVFWGTRKAGFQILCSFVELKEREMECSWGSGVMVSSHLWFLPFTLLLGYTAMQEECCRECAFKCGSDLTIVEGARNEHELCVKETMNCRYCWRAGVISRNEGEEKEELLVWTVVFSEKASVLLRVTVVREGKSVGEDGVIRDTLQSDEMRILEGTTVFSSS